jgi:hypothetical protein
MIKDFLQTSFCIFIVMILAITGAFFVIIVMTIEGLATIICYIFYRFFNLFKRNDT